MKTTVTEPQTWKRVIEFEIPAEELDAVIEAKLGDFRKKASLPGFRKGKVPASVVKQRFGQAARGEAVEEIINDSYKKACGEHNIVPASGASVTDVNDPEDGGPLRFTVETEVDPPIEITGYDKLKIRAKPKKIKESDADEQFDRFVERFAEYNDVARASKKGDCVKVEYKKVVIDGAEREDLKNHNPGYPIELGAEGVFKEFDKGLAGVKAGDEVEISVKFPKDYADQDAAGKVGEFSIKILSVQEKKLPKVDAEFLKKIGNFETADALKAEMLKGMEEEEKVRAKREAHTEAINTLIADNPFDVPPSKVETFVNMMIEDFEKQNGGSLPVSREELAEQYKPAAENALRRIRIVDYVADKEKIKATQEEVDREIEKMAAHYGHDFEELKKLFRQNGTTNRIRTELRERKTLDFLIGENSGG